MTLLKLVRAAQAKRGCRARSRGSTEQPCQLPSCGLLDQRKDAADLKRNVGGFPNGSWHRERLIWGYPSPRLDAG